MSVAAAIISPIGVSIRATRAITVAPSARTPLAGRAAAPSPPAFRAFLLGMPVLTRMVGFVTTTDPRRARAFYGSTLGFPLRHEDDFALVFDANGTMLRVAKAQTFTPARGTVLGWQVDDIYAAIGELAARGVRFEHFGLPFMPQDEHGVWAASATDRVSWFKDPDGNVLSISQHDAA